MSVSSFPSSPATAASRHRRRGLLSVLVLTLVVTGATPPAADAQSARPQASTSPGASTAAQVTAQPSGPLAASAAPARLPRWLDVQGVTASIRYRGVEASTGGWPLSAMQWTYNTRGRVHFDRHGHYSLNLFLLAGETFNQSWLLTGAGTGTAHYATALRHAFVSAEPVRGLTVHAGSMAPSRGLSTEITTFDNDGYLFGERVTVAGRLGRVVDDVSVTNAYLGEFLHPDLFHRSGHWTDRNYQQVLATKSLSRSLTLSADYTRQAGRDILHQAVHVQARDHLWFDTVRIEQYERLEGNGAYGMAATLEKSLTRTLKTAVGMASIDQGFGTLNGERFNTGTRWFVSGSHPLAGPLSVSWFYTHEIDPPTGSRNVQRVDLHLTYDVLAHVAHRASR